MSKGNEKHTLWQHGIWLNKPHHNTLTPETLEMKTDEGSDFWRETFYGFTRDSGHFYGMPAPESFTAQLRIRAEYEQLYDQAGIMVRVDESRWVKAGIELSDGRAMLSSVLTNGCSDWATAPYEGTQRISGCGQPSPGVSCVFRCRQMANSGRLCVWHRFHRRRLIWSAPCAAPRSVQASKCSFQSGLLALPLAKPCMI